MINPKFRAAIINLQLALELDNGSFACAVRGIEMKINNPKNRKFFIPFFVVIVSVHK